MKKSLLFFTLFITAVVITYLVSQKYSLVSTPAKQEGFQATPPEGASPPLNIPQAGPTPTSLQKEAPQPYAPPSTALLAPPPGQLASVNSAPQEDPALEKAPQARLKNILETLRGFLKSEAPNLAPNSDPTIQLPLQTARGDLQRLEDELNVLDRNPGLPSQLTQQDADQIEANLAYLQKKYRLSVNSISGALQEGFQSGSTSSGASVPATKDEMATASQKISVEIVRLQSSGSTDPVVLTRVDVLTQIKKSIDGIIDELDTGKRAPDDVPIMKEDLDKFLPVMSNANSALPQLLTGQGGAASPLNSLFQPQAAGNVNAAAAANDLFNMQAKDILENLSWELKLTQMGKAERDVAASLAQAMLSQTLGGARGSIDTSGSLEGAAEPGNATRGQFESVVKNLDTRTALAKMAGGVASGSSGTEAPRISGGGNIDKGNFDWKARSDFICKAIKKRGMDPQEQGCMSSDKKVSEDFSQRGQARMLCTRLGTNYDPSIPEACGCPPLSWPGWRP